jgi:aromatic-L-amino-acid decarboxylase
MRGLRMMCVLAHPDDESLGVGGALAKYAAEGVELCVVTATCGEKGRWGEGPDPGLEALGRIRETELRDAARTLGVGELHLLDYVDGDLDKSEPGEAVLRIVEHIRSFRPHVVVTFGPDGAYGHPDHIAVCQLATAAVAAAADPGAKPVRSSATHHVSKLYYLAWSHGKWEAYQSAFRTLTIRVDGVERRATPWPDWAITTVIDTEPYWPTVWKAVCCHKTQLALYGGLDRLAPEHHRQLWGTQEFYRVFSRVNGSRNRETDLFEGLREGDSRPGQSGDSAYPLGHPDTQGTGGRGEVPLRKGRQAALDMDGAQFRELGHALVEQIATFLGSIAARPVTRASTPDKVRSLLSMTGAVPEEGTDPHSWLPQVAETLFEHSLHNGHPRFWGYITASAAPIGILGDLLAAAVNPNVGAWKLSPIASEIERETVAWISDLLGYRAGCGGLLVSGGNVANLICFLAARRAMAGSAMREQGLPRDGSGRLRVYASEETHTWLQKAADISGLGTSAIRWIPVDDELRAKPSALERQIREDLDRGDRPFLVVGTAGTVGTGAIDPLRELASICRQHGLWYHVDGAYGALAAMVPGISPDLEALREADSVAMDPHKWLYLPLEAGCALVARREALSDTFSYHPPYYHFDEQVTNYFDYGIQNSRGFRALKVWLAIRQVGREGYRQMISEDIRLAQEFHRRLQAHETLEPLTQGLSICTFRYVPQDLRPIADAPRVREYLDELNRRTLTRIEESGEAFLSNAVVHGKFALRLCIVNFRTALDDVMSLPEIAERHGREMDRILRRQNLLTEA